MSRSSILPAAWALAAAAAFIAPPASAGGLDCADTGMSRSCCGPTAGCCCGRCGCRDEEEDRHCWWPCRKKNKVEIEAKFYAREAPRGFLLPTVPAILLAENAVPVRRNAAELEFAVRERARENLTLVRVANVPERAPPAENAPPAEEKAPQQPLPCESAGAPCASSDAEEMRRLRQEVAELRALAEELRRVRTAAAEQAE